MSIIGDYKEGMNFFQEKEYARAIEHFEMVLNRGNDSDCALMLGKCFEYGLGVEEDLVIAKDCYKRINIAKSHNGGVTFTPD